MKIKIFKEVPGLMAAPLMVGIMALVLYVLGSIPSAIQSPTGIREYRTIEEAESGIGIDIVLPAYFPNYLSWPPALIEGQIDPFSMAQVWFFSSDRSAETLMIYQIVSDSEDLPVALPWSDTVIEEIPVSINSSEGFLITGRGPDNRILNGVYWVKDGVHFVVVTTHSAQELLRIANSMHP
jgi:hypothetical protein